MKLSFLATTLTLLLGIGFSQSTYALERNDCVITQHTNNQSGIIMVTRQCNGAGLEILYVGYIL